MTVTKTDEKEKIAAGVAELDAIISDASLTEDERTLKLAQWIFGKDVRLVSTDEQERIAEGDEEGV
jgi:hypothetical protein